MLVWIFALVSAIGWVLLNRTTFGRRTISVGGNSVAARLAGIDVKRHTLYLYTLLGFACGIAAIMIIARTTTGSSTHGLLYELDAIAAVVIGGTLLTGGRGTIVGTVFGVLIFATLTNVFTLNNLDTSITGGGQGCDHRPRRAAPAAGGRPQRVHLAGRPNTRRHLDPGGGPEPTQLEAKMTEPTNRPFRRLLKTIGAMVAVGALVVGCTSNTPEPAAGRHDCGGLDRGAGRRQRRTR